MSLTVHTYDDGGSAPLEDPADISQVVVNDGCVVWVDLVDPGDDDFACLSEEFQLHPLAMDDARKHGQRPKLEHYPTHAFLVAYSHTLAEVDLFVGPNWVVTVRGRNEDGEPWSLDAARARIGRLASGDVNVGALVHTVLDTLVDGYFLANDAFEDEVEEFEERILTEQLGDEDRIQAELLSVRRRLVEFRRVVVPLRDVMSSLMRGDVSWVDDQTRLHLQDVYDHVLRAIEQLDSQRELVGNAVDAHLAIVSNRMNQVMKRLTAWGAILLGATLVAGIYGMNFEHMPELSWPFGYPMALGIMGLITVVGYRYFTRRHWL
ncbi:MAG TPA: magnesium/cobalt transporter CorA [Acidimicrobiales bacterium]|nr:magnesium/cobalt transporter CorA [Acidimicrobiales bacterium]